MYSIYDYYGIQNDIQNRYDAAKNAGNSATAIRTTPNAPFSSVTTQPEVAQQAETPMEEGITSIYQNPDANAEGALSVQPGGGNMPSWLSTPLNMFANTALGAASSMIGAPGSLNVLYGLLQDYENQNISVGNTARRVASAGLNYLPTGQLTSKITDPLLRQGANMVAGGVAKKGLSSIMDFLLGKPTVSTKNRLGDPENDPFGQEGQDSPLSANTIGNMDQDPAAYDPSNLTWTPVGPMATGNENQPGTYRGGFVDFGAYGGLGGWGGLGSNFAD